MTDGNAVKTIFSVASKEFSDEGIRKLSQLFEIEDVVVIAACTGATFSCSCLI